jgi:hypothetical protein
MFFSHFFVMLMVCHGPLQLLGSADGHPAVGMDTLATSPLRFSLVLITILQPWNRFVRFIGDV